ncbi:hypothetical protein AOQ89_00485 [bacterium endosymbiont of Pedicinus badii]|nr:hypothetical protein AOQ89_00485 [bacterium endosymbiont of Pedicinus badii]
MLINASKKTELRIALIENNELCDLGIERNDYKIKKSNIYKGKITRIEPSLEAVFVSYGMEKNGFLPFKEMNEEYLKKNKANKKYNFCKEFLIGKEIIIQINKEERSKKGASLTTYISLAGNYLVLLPNTTGSNGISRKIEGERRNKIKEIISNMYIPENMSIIIRTAGAEKTEKELQIDLNFLLNIWKKIQNSAKKKSAPCLIYKDSNIVIRTFRDYLISDIKEIIIDDYMVLNLAKNYICSLGKFEYAKKIKFYKGKIPIFEKYKIETQIESIFQREIRLPSGGSIFIDSTEALTAIDINSSKYTSACDIEETALNTNLEATYEIAKQIRLRDLGGLIVIDFIDMNIIDHQKEVENSFKKFIQKDRARIQIGKISKFGLLELSRQRLNYSLKVSSIHICPFCIGTGTFNSTNSFYISMLRTIKELCIRKSTNYIEIVVPTIIAKYLLRKKRNSLLSIKKNFFDIKIKTFSKKKTKIPNYEILEIKKNKNTKDFFLHHISKSFLKKICYLKKIFVFFISFLYKKVLYSIKIAKNKIFCLVKNKKKKKYSIYKKKKNFFLNHRKNRNNISFNKNKKIIKNKIIFDKYENEINFKKNKTFEYYTLSSIKNIINFKNSEIFYLAKNTEIQRNIYYLHRKKYSYSISKKNKKI